METKLKWNTKTQLHGGIAKRNTKVERSFGRKIEFEFYPLFLEYPYSSHYFTLLSLNMYKVY
jgi:hypothetical protein